MELKLTEKYFNNSFNKFDLVIIELLLEKYLNSYTFTDSDLKRFRKLRQELLYLIEKKVYGLEIQKIVNNETQPLNEQAHLSDKSPSSEEMPVPTPPEDLPKDLFNDFYFE